MIIYVCEYGDEYIANENTEESRDRKREWKRKHDKKNFGHHWARRVVRAKQA